MDVTRRNLLVAAPAGVALAALRPAEASNVKPTTPGVPDTPPPTDWLVALRRGLAQKSEPERSGS